MTFREYYGFPEGVNVTIVYKRTIWEEMPGFPCYNDMSSAFYQWKGSVVPELDVTPVTTMNSMFQDAINLNYLDVANWNTPNLTDTGKMFQGSGIKRILNSENWDTSKVTNMGDMLYSTSKLEAFPTLRCDSVAKNKYPLYYSNNNTSITEAGGFINMKSSWNDNYGLNKVPQLTRESCINILNGLYDFNSAGETPNSSQGNLKVHANFLTAVGDDIAIGTNKGWTITT